MSDLDKLLTNAGSAIAALFGHFGYDVTVTKSDNGPGTPATVAVAGLPSQMDKDQEASVTVALLDSAGEEISTAPSEWDVSIEGALSFVSYSVLTNVVHATRAGPGQFVATHKPSGLSHEAKTEVATDNTVPPNGGSDNEPTGHKVITHIRGNTLDWPGFSRVGRGWPGDEYPDRFFVVKDPDAKFGSAVEKRFFKGDISGWGWTIERQNHGPRWAFPAQYFKELYIRLEWKYSPNWDFHSGGDKLYTGAANVYVMHEVPHPPATFPTFPSGRVDEGGYAWFPIIAGKPTPPAGLGPVELRKQGYFPTVSRGRYHKVEILMIMNDPGQTNGSMRFWFDGVEYTRFYKVGSSKYRDVTFDRVGWNTEAEGLSTRTEIPLYWGGQGDTKKNNDWTRISEFYMSGKN